MKKGMGAMVCGFLFGSLLLFVSPIYAKLPPEIDDIIIRNRPLFGAEWDAEKLVAEFTQLLYPFASFMDEPTLLEVSQEEPYSKPTIIKKEALQDVEFLFSLLKYGYAAYQYFGGNAQFLTAKENIIADLDGQSYPLSIARFNDILVNRLNFINDGHFKIGYKVLVKSKGMYMNLDYDFFQDEHGYYLNQENGKVYLYKINQRQPEEFMWPSINDGGKVVYRVGMLEPVGQGEVNVEVALEEGGKQHLSLILQEVLGRYVFGTDVYKKYEVSGIPVISINKFPAWLPKSANFRRHDHILMQDFFMDAYHLRKEEILILDVRSHRGGDPGQGYSWIRNFTGSSFDKPAHLEVGLRTKTADKLVLLEFERGGDPNYYFYEQLFKNRQNSWEKIRVFLPELVENETVIVVLTDRRVASAGEWFVEGLRHLENVIIIGTNTAGYLLGNSTQTQLPNSRVRISFGTSISLPLGMRDCEGVGLLPDFWVPPADSLDLAIKFIQNYLQ